MKRRFVPIRFEDVPDSVFQALVAEVWSGSRSVWCGGWWRCVTGERDGLAEYANSRHDQWFRAADPMKGAA